MVAHSPTSTPSSTPATKPTLERSLRWTGAPDEFRPPRWASPQPRLADGSPWPSAGTIVKRWIEKYLVHGEGDALGLPARIGITWWYILQRLFEFDPESGRLAHDFALIGMGKGNAKTERLGEVADAELVGPIAPARSPLIVLQAASYGQTNELADAARLSIRGDPEHGRPGPLYGYFLDGVHLLEDRILHPEGTGRIQRHTSVGGTNDGGKPTAFLGDEIHEWATDRTRRVHTVQSKSLAKRAVLRRTPASLGLPKGVLLSGGLRAYITTAGADSDSLLGQLYDHGVDVARGHDDEGNPVVDPGFLFLWWEADEAWDLEDPEQRRQAILEANPEAGRSLPIANIERSFLDPTIARSEAIRYNANRWPDAEMRWMPASLWDASAPVTLDPGLPVHAVVRVAPDHRSAAIASAQRQGEKVVVRVTHLPESPLPLSEYLDVGTIEQHLAELWRSHKAPVLAPRRLRPGGPERILPTAGPQITYTGGFLEGMAQRLRALGAAVVDIPDSSQRRRAAGDALKSAVEQGRLVHEDDPELARQMGDVVERAMPAGAYLEAKAGKVIVAAVATMEAVRQAVGDASEKRVTKPRYGVGFGG
jgi:phage terminase large subunit-like protein